MCRSSDLLGYFISSHYSNSSSLLGVNCILLFDNKGSQKLSYLVILWCFCSSFTRYTPAPPVSPATTNVDESIEKSSVISV